MDILRGGRERRVHKEKKINMLNQRPGTAPQKLIEKKQTN